VVCIGVKVERKRLHLTNERLKQFLYHQNLLELFKNTLVFKNILEKYSNISYINVDILKARFH